MALSLRLFCFFLTAVATSAAEVKVVSFNVNLHNQSLDGTLALIKKQGADVILLQETTDKFESAAREALSASHSHIWFTGEDLDSGGGIAVVSRFPLVDKAFITKTTGAFGAQKFGVQAGKTVVQFVNIHLNPAGLPIPYDRPAAMHAMMLNNKPQVLELRNILKHCDAELPTIIAGDLNSFPSMSAYGQLTSRGFVDAHLSVDASANGVPTWKMTVSGEPLQARFDYVFHNDLLEAKGFKVVMNDYSDHALVACTLQLKDRSKDKNEH